MNGAVSYFGIADWVTLRDSRAANPDSQTPGLGGSEQTYVGSSCETEPDRSTVCAEASGNHYIDANDPPFFLLHSADDPAIPVTQSQQMVAELDTSGVLVDYRELDGLGHGWATKFAIPEVGDARDDVRTWLDALPPR